MNNDQWSTILPTEPGVYVWKEIGEGNHRAEVCEILLEENELKITFGPLYGNTDYFLKEVAERMWFKLPE
jgi:hypothetical protein